jgi:glycosyltransferase involved in cell wall biosynthesis
VRVLYSGLLRSPASWARVGRELLRVIARLGVEVGALRMRGFLYEADFPLPPGIPEVAREELPADVELTFAHPGLYGRLRCPRRVGILVYEADRMPAAWVEPIRRELDLLLLPSEFCRRGALSAGVPSHMIGRLPFGVDPRVFSPPAARPQSPFTFLAVAAPHRRKGLRELLEAYGAAFRANDDVRLIVKTTYDPARRPRRFRWELGPLEAEQRAAGLDHADSPRVEFITGSLSDRELSRLYREAHVFVQPSYGEGFGLAALEAAASGCAIILTGWGASAELFDREAAVHVAYDLASAEPYEYDRDSDGLVAVPRVADLAHAMDLIRRDEATLNDLRRRSPRIAARYSWDEAGRLLCGYLTDLAARPPRH